MATDGAATVADLMHAATTTVERQAHVAAAAYLMRQAGASAVVVTTDDEERVPIAIVTDTDISAVVADGRDVNSTRISDLVGRTPITTAPETPVAEAAATMLTAGVKHLPVVEDGRLVGMLGIEDACRGLLSASPTDVAS